MNPDVYTKEKLGQLLTEAVHASVMYHTHKSYTKNKILPENNEIKPEELALLLNMPLGEAIVILDELAQELSAPK